VWAQLLLQAEAVILRLALLLLAPVFAAHALMQELRGHGRAAAAAAAHGAEVQGEWEGKCAGLVWVGGLRQRELPKGGTPCGCQGPSRQAALQHHLLLLLLLLLPLGRQRAEHPPWDRVPLLLLHSPLLLLVLERLLLPWPHTTRHTAVAGADADPCLGRAAGQVCVMAVQGQVTQQVCVKRLHAAAAAFDGLALPLLVLLMLGLG